MSKNNITRQKKEIKRAEQERDYALAQSIYFLEKSKEQEKYMIRAREKAVGHINNAQGHVERLEKLSERLVQMQAEKDSGIKNKEVLIISITAE